MGDPVNGNQNCPTLSQLKDLWQELWEATKLGSPDAQKAMEDLEHIDADLALYAADKKRLDAIDGVVKSVFPMALPFGNLVEQFRSSMGVNAREMREQYVKDKRPVCFNG